MKPHAIAILLAALGTAAFLETTTPARAWWQFVSMGDNDERVVSTRYNTEEECKKALKATEEALRKIHPKRYPLVGSCEEYR